MPWRSARETRFAVPASEVHTAPARPYSVWLAISIASCSVEKVSTVITGPKPSSITAGFSAVHRSSTVGA